ncbi:MAG: efflux RND transporter periplasmic adaptor subunit [Gammaproteobacteria bacterium]|nr:efflux RND transporter periplasmic adaptor subunit [Gammaproteobacteria bacterium]
MTIADTSGQDVLLKPKSRARRTMLLSAVVLLVLALSVWVVVPGLQRWSQAEASVVRERLRLATVSRGDFVRDVSVQGRVVAAVSPTLYATQDGTITFFVEAGDRVAKGDRLAILDSPEVSNSLEQELATRQRFQIELERNRIQAKQQKLDNQKTVDLANVQLIAANREKRRSELAYEKKAISQIDYEKAHDELQTAELSHKHAVADAELDAERLDFEQKTKQLEADRQSLLVADLERQVDELTILSPVNGIVGNILVEQKTAVGRNQRVLSVVDLSQFEIEVQVPESYADDLAVGMTVEVRLDNNVNLATLVSVSPEIIDNQVTGRIRFDADVPRGLRQNQRLTTRILLESKDDVLMVPRGQFLQSGGGRIAYRVENDLAHRLAIEVGARSLNTVEILSGLQAGDTIVISSIDTFEGAETVLITN